MSFAEKTCCGSMGPNHRRGCTSAKKPEHKNYSDDELPPMKDYECLDDGKRWTSRQNYDEITCPRCKGTHLVQTK